MLNLETQAHIRHLFYAEHWKIGTIAEQLGVHHDAVRRALQTDSFHRELVLRPCITDPYLEFVRETLKNYPQLRATRIFQMVRDLGRLKLRGHPEVTEEENHCSKSDVMRPSGRKRGCNAIGGGTVLEPVAYDGRWE